ncbi:hypothetical protein JKF63_02272 [Porcisia hertigi]|uniref:MYND-type domain-containing protein n=1 Tax=Porcisia hertigi TaxID=2761500 RepID=A0A836L2W3_9TRYP|nr:hypothetical protein JKF63_02272 [Porcisia hertigi]
MSLSFQSGDPGLDFPLPHVNTLNQGNHSISPRNARNSRVTARVGEGDDKVFAPAEATSAQPVAPHRHLHRSFPLLNSARSRSASSHQQPSRAYPAAHCECAAPPPQRHSDSLALPGRRDERNSDAAPRGHYPYYEAHEVVRPSPSQPKQPYRLSSTANSAALASAHPCTAHDRGGGSNKLGRSITATAMTNPLEGGGVAPFVKSNGQEHPHSPTHPSTLPVTASGAQSLSNAAPLDVEPHGQTLDPLRSGPREGGSVALVSVEPNRGLGVVPTVLHREASCFRGASPSGKYLGEDLSNVLGNTFGEANPTTKSSCSRCKVVEEVLYSCPCGLARYCCTTCQRAHWPSHKAVCNHAVQATHPPTQRCDSCRRTSQTLRQCRCGFAFYCDTDCQRSDWPHHSPVCDITASQVLATALMCGRQAPRTRREAATQTVHWQINVHAVQSITRAEGLSGADCTPGMSASLHTSLHNRHVQSDSDEATDSFAGSSAQSSFMTLVDAIGASHLSSSRCTGVRAPSEHGLQVGADSGFGASETFHQNHEASVRTSSGLDVTRRTPTSTHTPLWAGDTGASHHGLSSARILSRSTHSTRSHHYTSVHYNNVCMSATTVGHHTDNPLLDASSVVGGSQSLHWNQTASQSHGAAGAAPTHHHCQTSLSSDPRTYVNYASVSEIGDRIPTTVVSAAAPDQLGVFAFFVASRQVIEREESRERATLFRSFRIGGAQLHMRLLGRKEEEERICILKEELLWRVVTGNPAWKKLKQEVRQF